VAIIVIVARFAWVFPATYLPRLLNQRLRARDPTSWRTVFVIAFTGVRGRGLAGRSTGAAIGASGGEDFPYAT